MRSIYWLTVLAFMLCFTSCKKEQERSEGFSISTRITKDPSFLNPVKSYGLTESTINQYIFLQLANYHPENLQLIPVLIEKIPEAVNIDQGEYSGTVRYDVNIKKDANWDDGTPITGYDYLFTIKTIKYEKLKVNPSIRSVFKQLMDVEVDVEDPKSFSIFVDQEYLLSKELSLIAEVLPEHIYDPGSSLRALKLESGKLIQDQSTDVERKDLLESFVNSFNHADCGRKVVSGSGPYELNDWITNQRLTLKKKLDYWGENYPENPYLSANADQILFAVYPSDNAAITELKNGTLDVLNNIDGISYSKLKQDERLKDKLSFYHPSQLKFYYIGINNHSPLFKQKENRKAIAHLLDVDAFIANFENGQGIRLPAPILPYRDYFNDSLQLVSYDVEKAKEYLEKAGWADSNNNGIIDKEIDGQIEEFEANILISGRNLGKNLALILQERAKEVGIKIDIITKSSKLIRPEIANRNFDLYPSGINYDLYPEDLYQYWHSDNDYPGGSNKFGFNNPKADSLIETIRQTNEAKQLEKLYREIQEVIYEDQALIFLYAPTNNIVVSKKLDPIVTVKKPGIFLNAFDHSRINN